jgi:hypothetical protein
MASMGPTLISLHMKDKMTRNKVSYNYVTIDLFHHFYSLPTAECYRIHLNLSFIQSEVSLSRNLIMICELMKFSYIF